MRVLFSGEVPVDGPRSGESGPGGTTLISPVHRGASCSIAATTPSASGPYTIRLVPTSTTFGALTASVPAS